MSLHGLLCTHCFYYACVTSVYHILLRLYEKLLKVADKGHQKAMEKVAYAMLFGDYMNQNVTRAKEMFEKLAIEGSPKAQMVYISHLKCKICHQRNQLKAILT